MPIARVFAGVALSAISSVAIAQGVAPPDATTLDKLAVFAATTISVGLCVALHYEALTALVGGLLRLRNRGRWGVIVVIFAVMITHTVEIVIFGVAYYWLTSLEGHAGSLAASYPLGFFDDVYFSAATFTTLGLGDIAPIGTLRLMVGIESLMGLVLITWSASFAFVYMERNWRRQFDIQRD